MTEHDRKEAINWITREMLKLHQEGYGNISKCQSHAVKLWKEKERIRKQVHYERIFGEVKEG